MNSATVLPPTPSLFRTNLFLQLALAEMLKDDIYTFTFLSGYKRHARWIFEWESATEENVGV